MLSGSARRLIVTALVAALALLVFQASAEAQCSMCRASLAGARNALFIRNFNIAVLVLLIPPVAMFCSIFVVLRRHKLHDDEAEALANPDAPEPKSRP